MITLPLPPTINATYKRNSRSFYTSNEAKQWKQDAYFLVKKQWRKKPLAGKLYLAIWWYLAHERDISSGLKILEDALQDAKVYLNDKQIYHEVLRKAFDKKNPRVEIEIEEMV